MQLYQRGNTWLTAQQLAEYNKKNQVVIEKEEPYISKVKEDKKEELETTKVFQDLPKINLDNDKVEMSSLKEIKPKKVK